MKRWFATSAASLWLFAALASAGVDHGNPKRYPFYDLKNDVVLNLLPEFVARTQSSGVIEVQGALEHRRDGRFVVARLPASPGAAERVCGTSSVPGAGLVVTWLGDSCERPYFKRRLRDLAASIEAVRFP
jgi:hypothetical protein